MPRRAAPRTRPRAGATPKPRTGARPKPQRGAKPKPVSPAFTEFLLDQLVGVGANARRLFGGVGLYVEGVMFGFAYGERVYFKVGPANVAAYDAVNAAPLIYAPDKKGQRVVSLREVPGEVLDDADEAAAWARAALAAASRSKR